MGDGGRGVCIVREALELKDAFARIVGDAQVCVRRRLHWLHQAFPGEALTILKRNCPVVYKTVLWASSSTTASSSVATRKSPKLCLDRIEKKLEARLDQLEGARVGALFAASKA